jgi:hypothetical protein
LAAASFSPKFVFTGLSSVTRVRRPAAGRATSASLKTVALDSGTALYTTPQPQLEHHTNGEENQEIENSNKGSKEGSKEGEKARYTSRQVGYPAEALIFFLEHDPEKACPALDAGWIPVSRLREALDTDRRLA